MAGFPSDVDVYPFLLPVGLLGGGVGTLRCSTVVVVGCAFTYDALTIWPFTAFRLIVTVLVIYISIQGLKVKTYLGRSPRWQPPG